MSSLSYFSQDLKGENLELVWWSWVCITVNYTTETELLFHMSHCVLCLSTEHELPRTKGCDCRSVSHWALPRPPSCSLGWSRESGNGATTAGCRHSHFWSYTQVPSNGAWGQIFSQPWLCHWFILCSRQVSNYCIFQLWCRHERYGSSYVLWNN